MTQWHKVDDLKIKEIEKVYKINKSIRKTAKVTGLHRNTILKYVNLLGLEKNTCSINNIYKVKPPSPDKPDYTEENNNCQEIEEKNIEIIREEEEQERKKREGKQSSNENQVAEKKQKYVSKLDKMINLLLERYEKDFYRIHPNFLSRDIGIFIDKFNVLTGNNPTVDNRSIIFASFGSNEDMLKLIKQIQDSTTKTG